MFPSEEFFVRDRFAVWDRTISSVQRSPYMDRSLSARLDAVVSGVRPAGFSLVRRVYAELSSVVTDRSGEHPVEILPAFYLGDVSWRSGVPRDPSSFAQRLGEAYGWVSDARAYFARRGVSLSVDDVLVRQRF